MDLITIKENMEINIAVIFLIQSILITGLIISCAMLKKMLVKIAQHQLAYGVFINSFMSEINKSVIASEEEKDISESTKSMEGETLQ